MDGSVQEERRRIMMQRKEIKKRFKVEAAFISGAIFFVICVMIGLSFLFSVGVTIASYYLISRLLNEKYESDPYSWNDEELLESCRSNHLALSRIGAGLGNSSISNKVAHLTAISSDILRFIERSHNEIYRAKTYIIRSLPMAVNILGEYQEFNLNLSYNADVSVTKRKIEGAIDLIVTEFNEAYSVILEDRFKVLDNEIDTVSGHNEIGKRSVDLLKERYGI